MVDLRKEIDGILRDYGHNILILHQDKTKRCSCWNDSYKTPNKECPQCLGLGYLFTIHKYISRCVMEQIPQSMPHIVNELAPAEIAISTRSFYLRYDSIVYPKDIIIDTSWNGNKAVVDAYTNLYEVGYVEPYRGDQGRIEYLKVFTKVDPVEHTFRIQDAIKQFNS